MNNQDFAIITHAIELARKRPGDLVSVYTMDETCFWASPSHHKLLGYKPEEMIGRHWKDSVAPEDHDHATLAGDDAFLNGQSIEFRLQAITKQGQRIPLRGRAWISIDTPKHTPVLVFQATPRD